MYQLQSRAENRLILLLSAIHFTHVLDFVIMMPLGPQFMRVFQIGPTEFGLMVSSYTFSAGAFGILGSFFMDRYDRRSSLLFLYSGFAISTLLCGLAPTHHYFIAARIVAGAFGGLLGATIFSIIGDAVPESRRGLATGRVMSAFSVASIIGVPIGLSLANVWNWRAPFFLLALFSLIILAFGRRAVPIMNAHVQKAISPNRFEELLKILFNRNHISAYLLSSMLMFGSFSVIPYISPVMVANAEFPETDLRLIYLIGGILTFFTSPLVGRLADRFGKYEVFFVSALISMIPIYLVTHVSPGPLWVLISFTSFFMMMSSARMVPAVSMITSSVKPEQRGGFMSINSSIQQFSSGIATTWAGHLIEKNAAGHITHYDLVGWIAISFTLICLWLGSRLKAES